MCPTHVPCAKGRLGGTARFDRVTVFVTAKSARRGRFGGALRCFAYVFSGLLLLSGCATIPSGLREGGIPARARVYGVPAIVQIRDHCGPAALSSLLTWAGRPATPEMLAPLVFLPGRSGTLAIDLAREIRARGLLAYQPPADLAVLLTEVAVGHPAIVLENRGLSAAPLWHYSVLAGYDLDERTVLLYAGASSPETVRLAAFSRTWRRAGGTALLALPPGELPAAQDARGILSALVDLEEAGRGEEAVSGYEEFLRRWPGNWRGAFGWGNALYRLEDKEGADAAFRRAHGTAPERPEPLNNLALMALGNGRVDVARAWAHMAIERATALGVDPAPYQDTLRSVREWKGSSPRD